MIFFIVVKKIFQLKKVRFLSLIRKKLRDKINYSFQKPILGIRENNNIDLAPT